MARREIMSKKSSEKKILSYSDVVNSRDRDLLVCCEKAVQIIKDNDWKCLDYENRLLSDCPRVIFDIQSVAIVDCKLCILNYDGTILVSLFGRKSHRSVYNDITVDLTTHPRIGEECLARYLPKHEEE